MWNRLRELIRPDKDLPERAYEIEWLYRVLDGTLYAPLRHEFHEEMGPNKEYVPLKDRRPAVRYGMCRLLVEDATGMVFSEGKFPTIECPDDEIRASILALIKETSLPWVMTEAAIFGSVGSIAILLQVFDARVFFTVMRATYLTPRWKSRAPDTLESVTERYKATREQLEAAGYTGLDRMVSDWWFQRRWDETREIWYHPWPVGKDDAGPVEDDGRTVEHGLGFVPLVWIKNLPGPAATGDRVDGACTFEAGIHIQIDLEYQLSQVGRGLKYSSDPTLLIKEPAVAEQGSIVKGAGNALVVSEKGDAKLLEIGGTASAAVLEYCEKLRQMALEAMHGNRASADKISAAQSGRALELMHYPLIQLAGHLRQSYGEVGLLKLLHMVAAVSRKMPLKVAGKPFPKIADDLPINLKWPDYFRATGIDRVQEANALVTLMVGGGMSRESAVKTVAQMYDIEDVPEEMARIEADQAAVLAGKSMGPTGNVRLVEGPNGNQGKGGDTPP